MFRRLGVDGGFRTAGMSCPTAVTARSCRMSVPFPGWRPCHPAGQLLPTLGCAKFPEDTRLWRSRLGANTCGHPRGGQVPVHFAEGRTSDPAACALWGVLCPV